MQNNNYDHLIFDDYLISPLDRTKRTKIEITYLRQFGYTKLDQFKKQYPGFPTVCKTLSDKLKKTLRFDHGTILQEKCKDEYYKNPKKCLYLKCNKIILYEKKENNFCNHTCSAKYNNANRDPSIYKKQSKSLKKYILENGFSQQNTNPTYKEGIHIDWKGDKHYYRSSYELKYYQYLDSFKIKYETEILRLEYYNSNKNKICIAIPDILINNHIYEIKSTWTLDLQEMKDKFKEYIALGYTPHLILENKEIDINEYVQTKKTIKDY